jgi:hypothetical protein
VTCVDLNLFGAKPADFELDQDLPLELGEQSLPGAIIQEVVQKGDAFEGGLTCSFAAEGVGLSFILAVLRQNVVAGEGP